MRAKIVVEADSAEAVEQVLAAGCAEIAVEEIEFHADGELLRHNRGVRLVEGLSAHAARGDHDGRRGPLVMVHIADPHPDE
jgi:hypothetical protein